MNGPSALAVTILILVLGSAHPAVAQGEDAFAGEWRNRNQTGGVVGANIFKEEGRWMVQLLGSCRPDPCVQNPEPLVMLAAAGRGGGPPRALATFQLANMRRVMTFRLGEETLVVEVYSMVTPVRGFSGPNSFSVDELTRTKPTAARLPPTRRPVR